MMIPVPQATRKMEHDVQSSDDTSIVRAGGINLIYFL